MTAANKDERLLAVIAKAQRRGSDRAIIRMLRATTWGIGALGLLFVSYIVALFIAGAHDNRRIDELEQRVNKLAAAASR